MGEAGSDQLKDRSFDVLYRASKRRHGLLRLRAQALVKALDSHEDACFLHRRQS